LYATYYILYIIKKIKNTNNLALDLDILKIEYTNAIIILNTIVKK